MFSLRARIRLYVKGPINTAKACSCASREARLAQSRTGFFHSGIAMSTRGFTTRILHCDRSTPIEHGALHKPLHTAIAYGYPDSRELARVFQGEQSGFTYARQG